MRKEIGLSVSAPLKARVIEAAKADGVTVSEWMRRCVRHNLSLREAAVTPAEYKRAIARNRAAMNAEKGDTFGDRTPGVDVDFVAAQRRIVGALFAIQQEG